MSGFFAGGMDRYRGGMREQQEASLAIVCESAVSVGRADATSAEARESELIAAELSTIQADFQHRLREAEYALF